jgi:catechol 2,3-dioxygenase-like lactoylglutathione lyase family enzyme
MKLRLNGVHHSARPAWKLRETFDFYHSTLGLPLVHCVAARGWGPDDHPDFLHFFFDSGAGSLIAFFYYIGTRQPEKLVHLPRYDHDASHTAWRVETREEVLAWRRRLESVGVEILYQIEHEVVESIYFRDPNGYYLEIGCPVRNVTELDARDAMATMEAAFAIEAAGEPIHGIEQVWRKKGDLVQAVIAGGAR